MFSVNLNKDFPRICPGRHFAVNGALIAVANILAAFNIELAEPGHRDKNLPEIEMSSGLLSYESQSV